jgi:two-component system, NtrC family, response regulator AtoC
VRYRRSRLSHDDENTSTNVEPSLLIDLKQPAASLLIYHRDGCEMVGLHEGKPVVVGRSRPADVPIRDGSLSRQHARFTLDGGAIWIEDLESTNGTKINGKKISRRTKAKEHDEVKLGGVTVAFHLRTAGEEQLIADQRLDSHDHMMARIEEEVVRARTFTRSFALLMVRSLEEGPAHVGRFDARVRALLRPVDGMALYGPEALLICQVETGLPQAIALAEAIVKPGKRGDPRLGCGVALFPDHATSADELLALVRQLTLRAGSKAPVQVGGGSGRPAPVAGEPALVVVSPRMRLLVDTARRVADAMLPCLILGETGTGKEVLARVIHESSGRRKQPLRCINCGAIPESLVESALFGHERGAFTGADKQAKGLFEEANGGSVLLDEVGELSPSAQAALLRVIETKRVSRVGSASDFPVDVRVLAATHRDLEQMCGAGQFRQDLFYRLNTLVLQIPPLRERAEEILPLAEKFMQEACVQNRCDVRSISPEARSQLLAYNWPGNVRELRNVIERAVVIAQENTITVDDLSERVRRTPAAPEIGNGTGPDVDAGGDIKERVRRYEAELLLQALRDNDWNQTKTAAALKMPLRTLVNKMRVLGLRKRYDSKA